MMTLTETRPRIRSCASLSLSLPLKDGIFAGMIVFFDEAFASSFTATQQRASSPGTEFGIFGTVVSPVWLLFEVPQQKSW